MAKIINRLCLVLKLVIILLTFGLTIFIMFSMYDSLEKELVGQNLLEFLKVILPFIVLIILFTINIMMGQKVVNDNIFFNIASTFSLMSVAYICYRAMYDTNMIFLYKTERNINFTYFSDQILIIKFMLYLIAIIDIVLIIRNKFLHKK